VYTAWIACPHGRDRRGSPTRETKRREAARSAARAPRRPRRPHAAAAAALGCLLVVLLAGAPPASARLEGIHKIQHVIMIMQENRSFDSYFGTYPGANGIPAGVCLPNPRGGCVAPFHNHEDRNGGGPHGTEAAVADINGGAMNGFVAQAQARLQCGLTGGCGKCRKIKRCAIDSMGYHDAREIPNYWTYAEDFVLQDQMFASASSWTCPNISTKCPSGRASARMRSTHSRAGARSRTRTTTTCRGRVHRPTTPHTTHGRT
jgi:phospholipase C